MIIIISLQIETVKSFLKYGTTKYGMKYGMKYGTTSLPPFIIAREQAKKVCLYR